MANTDKTMTNENGKRNNFKIELSEHVPFGAIAATKYEISNNILKQASELFHQVFADFEGAILETNSNEPTVALIFNHGQYGEDAICACSKSTAATVGSTVIDRGRARDSRIKDGDRYYLTQDGIDVIKDLLTRRAFNNGNPDFKKIVSEFSDRGPSNYYFNQMQPQYTKVSFISLDRLCGLLYGSKDENGEDVEYSVSIASAINPGYFSQNMVNNNYILNITKVSSKELTEFCNSIGIGSFGSGINIIR